MKAPEKVNQMEALKFSIQRQNEQGNALVEVIERVEEIENNMNTKYDRMSGMLKEVENRVHLEEADASKIKSIVNKKAHEISKIKYPDTDKYGAEYLELVGYARRRIYKRLKEHFNVTKYTSIRHVDREQAIGFVESIVLGDDFLQDYEQWRYERIKKREREQEIMNRGEGK